MRGPSVFPAQTTLDSRFRGNDEWENGNDERECRGDQGYVETSNVNVVEEMVSMIQTQRAYEINSKAVQTSDEMLAKLSQL